MKNVKILILIAFIVLSLSLIFLIASQKQKGVLLVKTSPDEAIVYIGENRYTTPVEIELKVGKYENIIVKKDGFEDYIIESFEIKKQEKTEIEVSLKIKISEEEKNFIALLPKETSRYKIEYETQEDGKLKYTILLYAILNRESQLPQYKKDLADYKKEALQWILSQSIEPEKLDITYLPKEAADL